MQNRIRIKSVEGDNRPATDIFSGKAPAFYRANGLAIEVGIFDRDGGLADLTGLTGMRLQLMTTGPDGGPGGDPALLYWEELVEAEDFETPTEAEWKDGTKAHVTWTLTPAQTAFAQGTYWLWAVSEGAVERTLFAGKVIVREDGSGAGEIQEPEPLQELRDEAIAAAAAAAADRVAVEAKAAQVTADRAAVQALRDEVEIMAPQIVDDAATAGAAAAQVVADNLAALGESLSYRGAWSTNAAPDPAERGWYWMISAACTFGSEIWAPGDCALYNGDTWQKVALDDILTGLKADLPQAFGPALHLDGVGGLVRLPSGVPVGAGDWTLVTRYRYVGGATSGIQIISGQGNTTRGPLSINYNATTHAWTVTAHGQSGSPTVSLGTYPLDAGLEYRVSVRKLAGTTDLRINGTLVGSGADPYDYAPWTCIAARNPDASPSGFFPMYLRELQFYDLGLSTSTLDAITAPQPTLPSVPPLYRWALAGLQADDSVFPGWRNQVGAFGYFASPDNDGFSASSAVATSADVRSNIVLPYGRTARIGFTVDALTGGTIDFEVYAVTGNVYTPFISSISAPGYYEVIVPNTYAPSSGNPIIRFTISSTSVAMQVSGFEYDILGCVGSWSADQDGRLGPQLRDRSPNRYDGLLAASGCTWTEPTGRDSIRARAVDASSSKYLLRAGDILPAACVVTALVVDGAPVALSGAQNPALRRIRLAPSGADLLVQRSDGTTHETLATVTPASLADVDLLLNFQLD